MEKKTVEGIIINEINYSETSKILYILTKEYGYISVLSKGSRNIKSKIRGISMKLVYANFTINYKENGLSTLIEGSLINSFKTITNDLKILNFTFYILDLIKNVLKENNDLEIFTLLKNTLLKLNDKFDPFIITNILEIKLLKYLGVNPNFKTCINCFTNDNLKTFDLTLGGMICNKCYQNNYIFNEYTIKLLKLFQEMDLNKLDKLNITSSKIRKEIDFFIKEYYQTYTGIILKNKVLIEKI